MIVLILVAILWVAVLVPGIISKLSERRNAGSIGRFHRRLDLLERTGPKLVQPAYRLTGTEASRPSAPLVVPVAPPPVRPNLRLLPPPAEGAPAMFEPEYEEPTGVIDIADVVVQMRANEDHDSLGDRPGEYSDEYEEYAEEDDERLHHLVALGDRIDAEVGGADRRGSAAFERRQRARRRRRNAFGALCALAAFTGLLGLARPLRGAWVASAVFLVLLVGFVGLAAYGQRIEAERRHLAKLQRTEREREREPEPESESTVVKYLSSEELSQYRAALASYYEFEDSRLVGGARAIG